jgi:hypothetical protein
VLTGIDGVETEGVLTGAVTGAVCVPVVGTAAPAVELDELLEPPHAARTSDTAATGHHRMIRVIRIASVLAI